MHFDERLQKDAGERWIGVGLSRFCYFFYSFLSIFKFRDICFQGLGARLVIFPFFVILFTVFVFFNEFNKELHSIWKPQQQSAQLSFLAISAFARLLQDVVLRSLWTENRQTAVTTPFAVHSSLGSRPTSLRILGKLNTPSSAEQPRCCFAVEEK